FTAMDHLERHLFANPTDLTPAADSQGIEIVATAGVTHEIEMIARRIKGLLTAQANGNGSAVAPGDILVVFRSLAETAPLVREIFAQFGIPSAVHAAPPLASAAITRALVAWVRLAVEDWPFRRVLAVLADNYFRPRWTQWQQGRAAVALEHLVRELQIPSGRADLSASVERLTAGAAAAAGTKKRLSAHSLHAHLAAPLLRKMRAVVDLLPSGPRRRIGPRRSMNWRAKSVCSTPPMTARSAPRRPAKIGSPGSD
ncbi:MAG: hypothetical protein WDZ48_02625, partial [Pirellulales bacterium]